MKFISGLAFLVVMTSQSFALTLGDFAGKYEVSSPLIPTINIITLDQKGGVTLVEKSVHGKLNCKGTSVFSGAKIASKLTCENGLSFEQEINVSKVTNLTAFTAPVYSTLFGQEIPMNFKRVK